MFCRSSAHMLASMSEIDPRVDMPLMDWSQLDVSGLLPTGTVTLLLADVEGSTRLWETQPEQMTAALALLNRTVNETVAAHDGGRRWPRSGCASGYTPARSSCATSPTTPVPRSTGPRGCVTWAMGGRHCCRG